MRFEVGKVYTFLRVLFKSERLSFGRIYLPWEDTLQNIEVINLTCKEHHRVGNEWSPEKKECDGFIFQDETGRQWYNQYPTASYGQLDDSGDRRVYPHFETSELLKCDELGNAVLDGQSQYIRLETPDAQDKWKMFESTMNSPFELAVKKLGDLYRCIYPREKPLLDEFKRKALKEHLDAMIVKVEMASNQKVIFEPLVLRYLDARPHTASGFIVARLSGDKPVVTLADKYVPEGAILTRQDFAKQVPLKSPFYRVQFQVVKGTMTEPKLLKADRWFPTGVSPTGDDSQDAILYFDFRYAGQHFDDAPYSEWNVDSLNDYNHNYMFADKKQAEAYIAFIKNPDNRSRFV